MAKIIVERPTAPLTITLVMNEQEAQALESLLYGRFPAQWSFLNTHLYYPLRQAMNDAKLPVSSGSSYD